MLVGLFSLIMSLFLGSTDVFYLDKIQDGIKKTVDDKDRKKELSGLLKDYEATVEEFNKSTKNEVKILKEKNLERNTTRDWYEAFFKVRMEERKELQNVFMDKRIELQNNITSEEWDLIIAKSQEAEGKEEAKEAKKESKAKGSDYLFEKTRQEVEEDFPDESKKTKVLNALDTYEKECREITKSYGQINANNSDLLIDKNLTKEQMQSMSDDLNAQREAIFEAYIDFFEVLNEELSDDEWEKLIKTINKEFM